MDVSTLTPLNVLIAVNASTLGAIVVYGTKVVRFFNRIEFKTDLMWADYETRVAERGHVHRRASDTDWGEQ